MTATTSAITTSLATRHCCACGRESMVWRDNPICPGCGVNMNNARAIALASGSKPRVVKHDDLETIASTGRTAPETK